MREMTAADLIQATGGKLLWGHEDTKVRHISLDSRNMEGDDLFVPIIGEKVDAHRFICQAIGQGAAAVFTSRHHSAAEVMAAIGEQCADAGDRKDQAEGAGAQKDQTKEAGDAGARRAQAAAWIEVEDTVKALQDVGAYCRKGRKIPLVGITGSVGKTTTREMIAAALSAGFTVYKTPGNSNSQVGVPVTIAEIPEDAQIGVIELGMSEPGEMTRIARVAQVDCAVMTNIGVTHIEQLGSRENILKEKLHIQDGMAPEGILFLNGDDVMLKDVQAAEGRRRILYGLADHCQYRGENLHLENGYPVFTAVHEDERVLVRLKVMGSHMVGNALAALAVAGEYGIPMEKAAARLEEFEGFKGRQQIFTVGGVTVIDDSYNASPVSMKAGLEVLCSMDTAGRKIAVLADMKELGPGAPGFHREIGAYIAEHPVDRLVLLGGLAAEIGHELSKLAPGIPVEYCDDLDQITGWLGEHLMPGDCVLFKGSNSMKLSRAVNDMKENGKNISPEG